LELTIMKALKPFIYACVLLLISSGISTVTVHASDGTTTGKDAKSSGELYLPAEDPVGALETGLDSARANNKLALVVMGANWCHDSRALAARLYEEPLRTVVNKHYEIIFVDVGYLEKGKDVISSLGIPIYYATPTVLIIDPVDKRVVNARNRNLWANAANVSMTESVDYFAHFAEANRNSLLSDGELDAELQSLLADIGDFEHLQATRLYDAYAVLTPMLRAYKEGDKDAFSEATWNEVRDYRYQVTADLENLRSEAHKRVAAGEQDIQLTYPVYPAFSWDPK